MKLPKSPQGYGHLPILDKCGTTTNGTCDRVVHALKGGDMGPVFEARQDPCHPGISTVGGKVFLITSGEGGPIECHN